MSLTAMVYYVLMAQCVVLTMLCLPYVRNVVTYIGQFIPVQAIKWYVLLAVGIVAFMSEEAFRNMYKFQMKRRELDIADPHYLEEKEALEPKLLRAQRDTYICGFALFFCFVVPAVYQLALQAQGKGRVQQRQAPAAAAAPAAPAPSTSEREHED